MIKINYLDTWKNVTKEMRQSHQNIQSQPCLSQDYIDHSLSISM